VNNAIVLTGIERAREGGGFIMRNKDDYTSSGTYGKIQYSYYLCKETFCAGGDSAQKTVEKSGFLCKAGLGMLLAPATAMSCSLTE
jgi:hypothetical protein